jgi:hypothetical protein
VRVKEILDQERHAGERRTLDRGHGFDVHHDRVDPRIDLVRPRTRRLEQFRRLDLAGPDQLGQSDGVVGPVSVHVRTVFHGQSLVAGVRERGDADR